MRLQASRLRRGRSSTWLLLGRARASESSFLTRARTRCEKGSMSGLDSFSGSYSPSREMAWTARWGIEPWAYHPKHVPLESPKEMADCRIDDKLAHAPRGCRARALPLRCPHGISTTALSRTGADISVGAPPCSHLRVRFRADHGSERVSAAVRHQPRDPIPSSVRRAAGPGAG